MKLFTKDYPSNDMVKYLLLVYMCFCPTLWHTLNLRRSYSERTTNVVR